MSQWRSHDPERDGEVVKDLARHIANLAERNKLPDKVVGSESVARVDPDKRIADLVAHAFHLGRACGARGVMHLMAGLDPDDSLPRGELIVERAGRDAGLAQRGPIH